MEIAVAELKSKMMKTLEERFSPTDSDRIVEVLMWADMCGYPTQGVLKFAGTDPLQDIIPQHEIRIERETAVSALINAGANPAPLVSQVATDRVIETADRSGLGIVGVRNMLSSTGAQGFYAKRIAEAGLIAIVLSSPMPSTAAFGSLGPLFGTNPIAFSFPTLGEPLIFDLTTSALNWYGLVLAEAQGVPIPEGVAIDSIGNSTTNPTAAMEGALLSFGGYKGAGLAMAVEVLGGVLSGADYCEEAGEWGSSFIAIDPEVLIGRDEFRRRCSDMIHKIKTSRTVPGVDEIRLPGERAARSYRQAIETGMVDIDETTLRELGYIDSQR